MGNTNSTSNENKDQELIISKIQNLLGGDSSEENNNNAWGSKDESNLIKNNLDSTFITNSKNFVNAVSGDTEDNLKNNEVFATTSEELPFTETEILIPGVLNENQNGGDIIQNLRNLILNSERLTENGNSNFLQNNINQIERLLTETENFNLVGGSNILQNLRNILDNLTETAPPAPVNNASIINLRGGALENQNLFTSEDQNNVHTEEHKQTGNMKADNVTEEKMQEEKNEAQSSEQSGGEQLDTELKEILKSLHKDSQNHKGGKGASKSRKSSRKSSKAKTKSSRRTKTDMTDMDMTEDTYDMDSDSGGETEDYLTSTSSLNTSDIQIKHYR